MRERQEQALRSWQTAQNSPVPEGGRALLRQENKKRGLPRIELGTSRTLSEHYTTKPKPRLQVNDSESSS